MALTKLETDYLDKHVEATKQLDSYTVYSNISDILSETIIDLSKEMKEELLRKVNLHICMVLNKEFTDVKEGALAIQDHFKNKK